jgi:hypothetical protein
MVEVVVIVAIVVGARARELVVEGAGSDAAGPQTV